MTNGSSVVTVGTYDGVHLGHQRLIAEARRDAATLGVPTIVVTFDRNPLEVVRPQAVPKALTDLEFRVELLAGTGVDDVVVVAFDEARAAQSAEDFVATELVKGLGAVSILVGANFRFGNRQRGDAALLTELGSHMGFSSRAVDLVTDDVSGMVVSSSAIRELIVGGDLTGAARLLGRPHEVRGFLRKGGALRKDGQSTLDLVASVALPPSGRYRVAIGEPGAATTVTYAEVRDDMIDLDVDSSSFGDRVLGLQFLAPT